MGASRVLLGSDYPFPLGEQKIGDLVRTCPGALTDAERDMVLGGNAAQFFGLDNLQVGRVEADERLTMAASAPAALLQTASLHQRQQRVDRRPPIAPWPFHGAPGVPQAAAPQPTSRALSTAVAMDPADDIGIGSVRAGIPAGIAASASAATASSVHLAAEAAEAAAPTLAFEMHASPHFASLLRPSVLNHIGGQSVGSVS